MKFISVSLDLTKLLIFIEKMLMSAELKRCVTWFIYFLDFLKVKHNCTKFHHCRIWATDFREVDFLLPLIREQPRKGPSWIGLIGIKFFLYQIRDLSNLCQVWSLFWHIFNGLVITIRRHIYNPAQHLQWSFLHRRCSNGFQIRLCCIYWIKCTMTNEY